MEFPSKTKLEAYLAEYQHLRETSKPIMNSIQPNRIAIMESAKKLGMLQNKALVLESENDLAILQDFTLFNHYTGNKNAIERYIQQHKFDLNPSEHRIMSAILNAFYSIFSIRQTSKGYGVIVHDILRSRDFLVMDVGLSTSGTNMLWLAGRLVPLEHYCMTTGAFLPVPSSLTGTTLTRHVNKFLAHRKEQHDDLHIFSQKHETAFAAQTIRFLLRSGASEQVGYV